MRHRYGFKELSRDSAERKALLRAQCTSLIMHERIITTLAKAKATQSLAEKLVTRAKNCNNSVAQLKENPTDNKAKIDALMVHNHRMSRRTLYTNDAVIKLYNDIAPLFKDRAGGYTRIIKLGNRKGDAATMAILEFVERTPKSLEAKDGEKKKKAKKPAKTDEQKALDKKRKEDRKLARQNNAKASSAVTSKVNTRQKTGGGNA